MITVVAPLAGVLSALATPAARFRAIGSGKWRWVILPWFFGVLAAAWYWCLVWPRLRARRRD